MILKTLVCSIDLDGVLNYYPGCWVDFINQREGTVFTTKEEALKTLGPEEYDALKHLYRISDYKANLKPRQDMVEFLRDLKSRGYYVIVATDRPFTQYPRMFEMTEEWLLKNDIPFDKLMSKKDLVNVKVDFHIDDEPFFSICIETYNRGKTIFNTLISVALQSYRSFEVVLIDNCSTDNTVQEITRFFKSQVFHEHLFSYTFQQNPVRLEELENWNSPLRLAKGKYIALLEGDDIYLASHLEQAYNIINEQCHIGVYSVGNQYAARPITGFITAKQYFLETYRLENVAAPSETIFIRENLGKPYLYNLETYHYCPEAALLLEIAKDGFNAYHNKEALVYRNRSTHISLLKRFCDRFKIVWNYRNYVPVQACFEALAFNFARMFKDILLFSYFKLIMLKEDGM